MLHLCFGQSTEVMSEHDSKDIAEDEELRELREILEPLLLAPHASLHGTTAKFSSDVELSMSANVGKF